MISTLPAEAVTKNPRLDAAPRLESGDHLPRTEFKRRYAAMTGIKKAELIEGMVIMPSPVPHQHSEANSLLSWWLVSYALATPGCGWRSAN